MDESSHHLADTVVSIKDGLDVKLDVSVKCSLELSRYLLYGTVNRSGQGYPLASCVCRNLLDSPNAKLKNRMTASRYRRQIRHDLSTSLGVHENMVP